MTHSGQIKTRYLYWKIKGKVSYVVFTVCNFIIRAKLDHLVGQSWPASHIHYQPIAMTEYLPQSS